MRRINGTCQQEYSPQQKGRRKRRNAKEGKKVNRIELYPQGGLMVIHSDKCSDKEPGSNMEKIFPSQSEVFKDILEEIAPILRNMDAETLKQRRDERDRTDQKNRELEEYLGIALQATKRLEARVQANKMGKVREERRKTILDEGKKVDFPHNGNHNRG